jgi:DNA (cytosine-5)-methyltransferase 3A
MNKIDRDIISSILGVEPVEINSSIFSAQDRSRYYWANFEIESLPEDKGLVLRDIVLSPEDVDSKYWYKDKDYILFEGWENKKIIGHLNVKVHDIGKRIYNLNDKCATLTACRGGYRQKKIIQNDVCRKLTPIEYERLQTIPEGYTEGVSDTHRYNMLGDGWTVDVIAHIFKSIA